MPERDVEQTKEIGIKVRDAYQTTDEVITVDGPNGSVDVAVTSLDDKGLYRVLGPDGQPTGQVFVRPGGEDEDARLGRELPTSGGDSVLVRDVHRNAVPELLVEQVQRAAAAPTELIPRITEETTARSEPLPAPVTGNVTENSVQSRRTGWRKFVPERVNKALDARARQKTMEKNRVRVEISRPGSGRLVK